MPHWKNECIDALRDANDVEVVARPLGAERGSTFLRRVFGGAMLRPTDSAASQAAHARCDMLLDLRNAAPDLNALCDEIPYWYFSDGDGRSLGELPGSSEIARGSRTFTLQLRRADASSTTTLRTGTFKLLYGYGRSLEVALDECLRWPAITVAAPALHEKDRALLNDSQAAPRPNPFAFVWYVLRAFFVHTYVHLFLDARWEVGLIEGSPADFLNDGYVPDVRWLRESSGFFADPFVVTMMDRRYVFGERLDAETRNGFIACLEVGADGQVLHDAPVLKSSTHLSYPYVFQDRGAWYMVPESAQAERAILYRAVEAPFQWEPFATLVEGVGSCDNTIVRHADRWWLFCTHPSRDANLNLFLYHASDLSGPWIAHVANPVKTDIRSARPAGTPFIVDGTLYRPAQNCARSYGDAITFNRITTLDEREFSEEVAATLHHRSAGKPSEGVHTISHSNGTVAIDSKTVINASSRLVRQRLGELMTRALRFAT